MNWINTKFKKPDHTCDVLVRIEIPETTTVKFYTATYCPTKNRWWMNSYIDIDTQIDINPTLECLTDEIKSQRYSCLFDSKEGKVTHWAEFDDPQA